MKRTGVALIAAGIILNSAIQTLNAFPCWIVFLFAHDIVADIYAVPWALVLIPGGAFLIWRGRQYAAQASAKRIISDSKPHLLYLRAFRSDTSTAKQVFDAFTALNVLLGLQSEEEQLAEVLQPFGGLIAIGQPGESLPTPGAARIYTSDEEWKDIVKRQIQAAQLVVIRADAGENVLWELTQALKILNPQKLLILLLDMKVRDYESFRTRANSILDVPLPESTRLRRYGSVSGFIGFAAGWKPSFFALRAPFFRGGSFKRRCKYALKPVFESFGLEWQAPPVSAQVLAMLALLLALWPLLLTLSLSAFGGKAAKSCAARSLVTMASPSSRKEWAGNLGTASTARGNRDVGNALSFPGESLKLQLPAKLDPDRRHAVFVTADQPQPV